MMLAQALSRFKAHAASIEPGRLFDPRSRWVYILLAAWAAVFASAFLASDFYVGNWTVPKLVVLAFVLLVSSSLGRRYRLDRAALFLETITVPLIVGALSLGSVSLVAAHSAPFADDMLAWIDAHLSFNWLSLLAIYGTHPWLAPVSRLAYKAFLPQMMFLPALICIVRGDEATWRYLLAFVIGSVTTILLFPFVPAAGPYIHFNVSPDLIPAIGQTYPPYWQWHFHTWIEQLRSGVVRDITRPMGGLVSFPSYHTIMGVLFAWSCWGIRYLRWPVLILNIAMIASTLISGAHYLIDIVGGVIVAVAAITVASAVITKDIKA